jgi:hypothetical protein
MTKQRVWVLTQTWKTQVNTPPTVDVFEHWVQAVEKMRELVDEYVEGQAAKITKLNREIDNIKFFADHAGTILIEGDLMIDLDSFEIVPAPPGDG